ARNASRFGDSLAQPAYVELGEIGLARRGTRDTGNGKRDALPGWLSALYTQGEPPRQELLESYLHDAPVSPVPCPVSRSKLSWWSLLEMLPALPGSDVPWEPQSLLL